MKILREYQSDFGKTYVQVEQDDGSRLELAFDHAPKKAEVEKVVNELPKAESVAVSDVGNLTIDHAVAFLQTEFSKIKDQKVLDAEKAKLDSLVKMTAAVAVEELP